MAVFSSELVKEKGRMAFREPAVEVRIILETIKKICVQGDTLA